MEIDVMFKAWADHAEAMEKGQKKVLSALQPVPLWKSLGAGNVPVASTAAQTITLGGPSAGRQWFVHRIGILGADGHTAVSGAIADVYAGPGEVANASSQLYSGLAVPTIIVEGRFHNPLQYGDRLYVIVTNPPANQVLQFVAGIEDYPLPAESTLSIK